MFKLTEEKVHEALENTFAHIVAESGEVVDGRNLIAHAEEAGEGASNSIHGYFLVLQKMEDAFYEECYSAIAEYYSSEFQFPLGMDMYEVAEWVDSWVETTCDIAPWYREKLA